VQAISNQKLPWRARLVSLRNLKPLLRMLWETSPALMTGTVTLRILRAVFPLLLLLIPKLILDAVVSYLQHRSNGTARIWMLVILEFCFAVLGDVLGRLNAMVDSLLGDRFTNQMSIRLMRHSSTLDLASFEDPIFYDKQERARGQTSGRLSLLAALLNLGQDLLTVIVLSAGIVVFSPWLIALLLVAMVPPFLGETHFSSLIYSVLYHWTPQRRQLEYLRYIGASAQTAKEVKIFGLGNYLIHKYKKVSDDICAENKLLAMKRAIVGSSLSLVSSSGYYGGYALILIRTLSASISIGTFVFLASAFSRSRLYIERISSSLNDIVEQAVLLKDLIEFFEIQPSVRSSPKALPVPRPIQRGFEFRGVSFAYPGSEQQVICNLNLHLRPKEKIALIGENGAGKTTIVKLLARLYDPSAGRILLDGIDLRDYDIDDLYRQIGVIFQDYVRYDTTIRENVGFGDIDFLWHQTRIQAAAQKSGASEFIERFPESYDQILGRRFTGGVDLSGGEWQKLALARAYMRDAQLIILDEPTATLDARAEYEVFQRFSALTHGRISVLISHRFSTVRMADRIIVLEKGEVLEEGTHDQLLALDGRYAELFGLQAAGYR
jgi:ATP-binding cassette subfamily B protein